MFEIRKNNLKIDFEVDNAGRIYYQYFGLENINLLKDNMNVTNHHLFELQLSEFNHNGNHCDKQIDTEFSKSAKYVSHSFKDNELVIVTRNDDVKIRTHYIFYDNCDGFSVYHEVTNISLKPIILEYITSFHLFGFGSESKNNHENMICHKAYNSWHTECQWTHKSFLDEGIFNSNNKVNMRRFSINNTGSWSSKEYLPMIGITDNNKNLNILAQIENNGSWHIEIGDYYNDYYMNLCGPNFIDNGCAIKILPNEVFTSCRCSVVISSSFYESIKEITKLRRNLLTKDSDDYNDLPIIYNDFMHANWDRQSQDSILNLVDSAKEAGADTFVIDAGWFDSRSNWPIYLGVWEEDPLNYPHGGLKAVFNYIRSKNMKVGIWTEIEVMAINCPLVKNLPDDFFFSLNKHKCIYNNRYFLNFDNKEAYNWALKTLSNLIEKYQIDYLKNDYNESIGSGTDNGYFSYGEGLLKHNRAFINLINELRHKYPHLTIESCASGGLRMDYEMLKTCHIQSTSDQEEYYLYPYIASNIFTAVLPEQAGIWSYPVNCRATKEISNEEVIFNMVNSLLGRIHLASILNKLTPFQMKLVKEATNIYKDLKEFKKNALPIFPCGTSYFFKNSFVCCGLEYQDTILLSSWNTTNMHQDIEIPLRNYRIKSVKVLYPTLIDIKYSFDIDNRVLHYACSGYNACVFEIKLDL